MSATPFDACIYDCWEKAIEAPPNPAETMLILDPPYGVDTDVSKITACYLGHQISANGQNDTLLELAIAPLKRAIELGYQTIYLCNYRRAKLEEAIDQITAGCTVTRHDFGECRSLGNSAGRLSHGKRKDGRKRGSEAIWEIVSGAQNFRLRKTDGTTTPIGSEPLFRSAKLSAPEKAPESNARASFERLIQRGTGINNSEDLFSLLLEAAGEMGQIAADELQALGIALDRCSIDPKERNGRIYHSMRYAAKGGKRKPKRSSIKGEALVVAREQIDRRNLYHWLNHRIAEVYEIIAKLKKR
jgi:hypothetical protein